MSKNITLREKLDYLVKTTGRKENEIFADAVEKGLNDIYSRIIADAYIAGEINRKRAIEELGQEKIEDLDYAISSVDKDIRWGLKSG